MSTHTPGPWTLQPIGDETECNILGAGRELIATVSDNDAPSIVKSVNIAPKLADALRYAFAYATNPAACEEEACEATGGNVTALDALAEKARAALAEWDNAK